MTKQKKKTIKAIVWILVILIIISLVAVVLFGNSRASKLVNYTEKLAKKTTIVEYVTATGNAKPCDTQSVFSTQNAVVTTVKLEEGSFVAKNQVVLYVSGTAYTSPISGIITSLKVEVDEQVVPNQTLFTVVDYSQFDISASINESMINKLSIGDRAEITFNSLPNEVFSASLTKIGLDGTISGSITLFPVTLKLDMTNSYAKYIRNNMTCEVKIISAEHKDVIAVSAKAISYVDTTPYVLVQEKGEYTLREVSIGASDGLNVEIVSGLSEGEKVFYTENSSSILDQMMGGFQR